MPVIKDADRLSVHGLNRQIRDLADRARGQKLRLDDIQGGTFTLDNTGWTGSIITQPIINAPEVGILTMESIVKRPVVVETPNGDLIGVRPMMYVTPWLRPSGHGRRAGGQVRGRRQALARSGGLRPPRSGSRARSMRVVVTGGAGFIGRAIVERLVARGDEVVALVRDPARAGHLKGDHVTLLISDLSSQAAMTAQMRGADAVIHSAGSYRIGIKPSERDAMWDANVGATERVLDAAVAAGVPAHRLRVHRQRLRRHARRDRRRDLPARPSEGFVSWYDETKYRAHEAAEKRIAAGAPIVIVQPGQVYGPNDHSAASAQLDSAYTRQAALPRSCRPRAGLGPRP